MNLGKVYTKKSVANFMVNLFSSNRKKILDPCFGGGVFVDSVLDSTNFDIDAIEIDKVAYNSYKNPCPYRCNLINDNFFNVNIQGYDGIIMNPPYVRHEEIDKMASIGISKSLLKEACSPLTVPSKSNLYTYFILRSAYLLPEDGEMVAIFPNTWKLTPDGQKFEHLLGTMGAIEMYINVEGNPFESNPLVDVCIMKFVKGSKTTTTYSTIIINGSSILKSEAEEVVTISDKSMPLLKDIAHVRRGISTGSNQIFINPSINDNNHIKKIISSPKSVSGYTTNKSCLDRLLAIDNIGSISEEEENYLKLQATNILSTGKPVTLKNLIENNKAWFLLKLHPAGQIIFPYIIRNNIRFIINEQQCLVRDNFYVISSKYDPYILFALLNNYYSYYQLEMKGKRYGNGLLKIQAYDLNSIHIPDISKIETADLKNLSSFALKLIETSDDKYIDCITKTISKYYSYTDAKNLYMNSKLKRIL